MNLDDVPRVSAQYAREKLTSGDDSFLLVNIYSQEKYDQSHLEGAISMSDFRSRQDSLPKDTEIAFY